MKLVKMIGTLAITTEGDYQVNGVCKDVTVAIVSQLWTFSRVAMHAGFDRVDT